MQKELNEQLPERETSAARLLAASAKRSLDPNVEIAWEAPFDGDKFFLPERRCLLYGTDVWTRLSREQRIELSKHELANVLEVAIWGELILMQMLLRHAYDEDRRSKHVRYALTEIADECRHSSMFGRMLEKLDCPAYDVGRVTHALGRWLKSTSPDALSFIAAVWLEEATDALQREIMVDETVEPLVRAMFRIHVTEEARHIRYGRDEGVRQWKATLEGRFSLPARAFTSFVTGTAAAMYLSRYVQPSIYERIGLSRFEATRLAMTNEHTHRSLRFASARALDYCRDLGVAGFPASLFWKAMGIEDATERAVAVARPTIEPSSAR